jgi:hypothetical protein
VHCTEEDGDGEFGGRGTEVEGGCGEKGAVDDGVAVQVLAYSRAEWEWSD